MKLEEVQLVVYSPTGTTRRVVEGIAAGLGEPAVSILDLTLPGSVPSEPVEVDADLVLVGAPVYGGRVPSTQIERLQVVRGKGIPAVLVAVYGNRAFEDALVELEDWASGAGFTPVAGAAFVGEHSFNTEETSIAPGRPDEQDLATARQFGAALCQRLESVTATSDLSPFALPGDRPYRKRGRGKPIAPETDTELCTLCGECSLVCPTAAIVVGDEVVTDAELCTVCCACIRACPTGARVMLDQGLLQTARWLATEHGARREPELFT